MENRGLRRPQWGFAVILLIALLATACGGRVEVVVDEAVRLSDGNSLSYAILKGKYRRHS